MEPKDENIEKKVYKVTPDSTKESPVEKSKISKIAGVIKSQPEIQAIKENFAEKILDFVVDEAVTEYTKESKNKSTEAKKSLTRLSDEKEISALLKQATDTIHQELEKGLGKGLKEKGRKISLSPVDEIKYYMKVPKPRFDYVPKDKVLSVEDSYPRTINTLFDVAFCLLDGSFGEKLKAIYSSEIPHEISINTLLTLMLVYISKAGKSHELYISGPEIFNKFKGDKGFNDLVADLKNIDIDLIEDWVLVPAAGLALSLNSIVKLSDYLDRLNLEPSVILALMKIFKSFLSNLVHPSHLLVELLIKMNLTDGAIEAALMIRNNTDRSKSLVMLIETLLNSKDFDGARELWDLIPTKLEKSRATIKIAEALIECGQMEEALKFAKETQNTEENDNLLREIALCIAKQKNVGKAMEVTGMIKDYEVKAYTLSHLVNILCRQSDFSDAKKIAISIGDQGFKEDAFKDIVKSLLQRRQFDDAIKFVESIKNPREKQKLARLIEASLKVLHQDEKVGAVRNIFSLIQPPKRAA